jgi:hypothetical protein
MRAKETIAAKAAAALEPLASLFAGQTALVFATGPSLPQLWSPERPLPWPAIAISDAWQVVPQANVLYSTDAHWWMHHRGVPKFEGVRVGYEGPGPAGIIWLKGSGGEGYDPRLGYVRHGQSSGHAAVHLAAQLGAQRVILVGFDGHTVNGKSHFFGEHEKAIRKPMPFELWRERMAGLAKELEKRAVSVMNATPGSTLRCFPIVDLETVLQADAAVKRQSA